MSENQTKDAETLKIVFFTLFLDLVGFSIIFPLFPAILDYYIPENNAHGPVGLLGTIIQPLYQLAEASNHENAKFITTVLFGGILGSIYSLLQFIFAPIWGSLSDKHGRKKILLITIGGLAVSYLIWGFAGNFWILILARIIGGIMGGNLSVATSIVADVTTKEKRTSGMALIGVAFGLGFIIGPAIGGILSQFNLLEIIPGLQRFGVNPFSITAFFSLFLAIINLVWVQIRLKESLSISLRTKTKAEPLKIFRLFSYGTQKTKHLNTIYLIYMTAFSGMEFTLTFLAVDRFFFGTLQNGGMFVYIGFILILTQGILVRKIAPFVEETKIASVGLLLGSVAFILLSLANSLFVFFFALSFLALSIGLTSPSMSSLASLFAKENDQGTVLGLFRSAGSFARAIGPLLAAFAYFFFGAAIAYILGALIVGVALMKIKGLKEIQSSTECVI